MTAQTDQTLTLREAAEDLDVHYMTAYRYVRLGLLNARKVGSTWQVTTEDLEAFKNRSAHTDDENGRKSAPWDERFEARLVAGDQAGSWAVVEAALASGMEVRDIYMQVVSPTMRRIGDRWAEGNLDIATEHRASGIAHRILGRLSHRLARRGRSRGVVVLGTPPGDLHFLPLTMVADLLRSIGFEVMDLGCNLPPESFVAAAAETDRLSAIGVSVTTPDRDDVVRETVTQLRAAFPDTPLFMGGSGIRDEAHARELGAEHYAPDAAAALELFDTL